MVAGDPFLKILNAPANEAGFMPITHAFATGIEFAAGEVVAIKNEDAAQLVSVYLRGYTTTAE